MNIALDAFVPWRDDALLPQESTYSLWNKVAWFAVIAPAQLVRLCRGPGHWSAPTELGYGNASWSRHLVDVSKLPCIHGHAFPDALDIYHRATEEELPDGWSSFYLRTCKDCITEGVHLRLHQHLAVAMCPIHGTPLSNTCESCGGRSPYASGVHKAFRCALCGHRFTATEDIRFQFSKVYASRVAMLCNDVCKWVRPLNAGVRSDCLGETWRSNIDEDIARIDTSFLLLAGMRKSSAQIPTWLTKPATIDGDIIIAGIYPCKRPSKHAIFMVTDIEQWEVQRRGPETVPEVVVQGVHRRYEDHPVVVTYHEAIKTLTANFLDSIGALHPDCIETPRLMEDLVQGHRRVMNFDLFNCCPVALGMWIWRQRAGEYFKTMLTHPHRYFHDTGLELSNCGAGLLFYVLERSDLHACILAAHHCSRYLHKTHDHGGAIDMLSRWQYGRTYLRHQPKEWLAAGHAHAGVSFIWADATRLIKQTGCCGLEPYYHLLRRRMSRLSEYNPVTGRDEFVDVEATWKKRAEEHLRTLPPARNSWIFSAAFRRPCDRKNKKNASFPIGNQHTPPASNDIRTGITMNFEVWMPDGSSDVQDNELYPSLDEHGQG